MGVPNPYPTIDEYLRKRLMPVEGAIPQVQGIEMYGDSIPAGTVGGDLYEYINFQQRYDIEARIERAKKLSQEFLEPLPAGAEPRNSADDHVEWLKMQPGFSPVLESDYRWARSSEQVRVAENLRELHNMAGVLVVDAQGHGLISAKIASTVHDTFQAFMLADLDRWGRTTMDMFERINLRLAQSKTARNALGRNEDSSAREIATMLYGEVHPYGYFRFVNFGHPPPLVYSAEFGTFARIDSARMVQFLALGLQIPADHPDKKKYQSMKFREHRARNSDIAEITLMSPGDILFLYSDGVYDGVAEDDRHRLEEVMRGCHWKSAKDICGALLDAAVKQDEVQRANGDEDVIDDKTVLVIKRSSQ